jgi:hypothetical protein
MVTNIDFSLQISPVTNSQAIERWSVRFRSLFAQIRGLGQEDSDGFKVPLCRAR